MTRKKIEIFSWQEFFFLVICLSSLDFINDQWPQVFILYTSHRRIPRYSPFLQLMRYLSINQSIYICIYFIKSRLVSSHSCIVCTISPFQIQARSESFRLFATSLERDIVTAHLHHRASRSSFLGASCSSHHSALLPWIMHQNHIACVCFMHFLIISSLLRSVKMQSPLVALATTPQERKESGSLTVKKLTES